MAALNGMGIGHNDRVAIVLPNGPEMASAFLSVAAGASTAPLNQAYRTPEFEFYMSDLRPKALLVERGSDSDAVAVANRLGVTVVELEDLIRIECPAVRTTLCHAGQSGNLSCVSARWRPEGRHPGDSHGC